MYNRNKFKTIIHIYSRYACKRNWERAHALIPWNYSAVLSFMKFVLMKLRLLYCYGNLLHMAEAFRVALRLRIFSIQSKKNQFNVKFINKILIQNINEKIGKQNMMKARCCSTNLHCIHAKCQVIANRECVDGGTRIQCDREQKIYEHTQHMLERRSWNSSFHLINTCSEFR